MNILLCAYACEPNKGSEPEVGWRVVTNIAKLLPNDKIFVITKANNKDAIEKENYPKNIQFLYYELPKSISFWKKGGRGVRTYYYLWMIGAMKYIKTLNISFDIIHHITFVNDWLPSNFIYLKDKSNKFIWGPIGSHDPLPEKFLYGSKKYKEKIRIFLQYFFRNFDFNFRKCKKDADIIIGINKNVKNKISLKDNKFLNIPAIGMEEEFVKNAVHRENSEFIVVSIGRLIYIKNFKLTIEIFEEFVKNNPSVKAKLKIIGDGEDKNYLKNLVKELQIEDYVEFTGKIPLKQVYEELSKASVFLFPTLENAGFVILEAMSYELPILALDYGGPQQFILSNKNKQLSDINLEYKDIVQDLAKKLEFFYKNRDERNIIGKQNKKDVLNNFTWEAKTKQFIKIYKDLLNEK